MLPTTLPLLDWNLFANPLLPAAKTTIDLQLMDWNLFAEPFIANTILSPDIFIMWISD